MPLTTMTATLYMHTVSTHLPEHIFTTLDLFLQAGTKVLAYSKIKNPLPHSLQYSKIKNALPHSLQYSKIKNPLPHSLQSLLVFFKSILTTL